MSLSETASLRDTIMPEVYAISAEHQQRTRGTGDAPLDDTCTSVNECIAVLVMHCADLVSYLVGEEIPAQNMHRVAITLATDAAEVARRVRLK